MSLLWKSTDGLMLKNPDKGGAAYRCDCCPCGVNWYIATLCPCLNCGSSGPAFVGSSIPQGGGFVTVEYGEDGVPYNLKCLDMVPVAPRDSNHPLSPVLEDSVNHWGCLTVPLRSILYAIRHTTVPAPFDGTVGAELFINGVLVGGTPPWTWGPQACDENDEVEIGDALDAVSAPVTGIVLDNRFDGAGLFNVDLRITFNATEAGVADVVYDCRKTIWVVDPGEGWGADPWIGAVGIVPEFTGFDEQNCCVEGTEPETGAPVGMFVRHLRGPFASYADAVAVLAEFEGLIQAYAATCVCESDCGTGSIAADSILGTGPGTWQLDYAAAGDPEAGAGCPYGWILAEFYVPTSENWTIEARLVRSNGETVAIGDGQHLVAPCDYVQFWITAADPESIDVATEIGSFGTRQKVMATNACCLEDEESPYFEFTWDYAHGGDPENPEEFVVGQTGVPSTSAEWADYGCWKAGGGYFVGGECVSPEAP